MGASDAGRAGEDLGRLNVPRSDSFIWSASADYVISGVTS
jgi:hypothetical protein